MTWVYFEESDRQVSAPAFSLEQFGGSRRALHDFYEQSSLVLLFPDGKSTLHQALDRFAAHLDEIERQGAQVLALLPNTIEETGLVYETGALPFPLLADEGGRVRSKYAGLMVAELAPEGSDLLFVLDSYGAPWAAYVGESLDEDGLIDDVMSWLAFIGIQCPE